MHVWHAILIHKNKCIALNSKRCGYCGVGNKYLESTNSVIASIINLPYDGLQNGTKLSTCNLMKYNSCSAHFSEGHGHIVFSSIQTVHVFIMIYFVSTSQCPYEICVIVKATDSCLK